jgi:TolB protein
LAVSPALGQVNASPLGIFQAETDVGTVEFNPTRQTYTINGGGANIWGTNDAFHFVWKKMSGDFTLAADLAAYFGTLSPADGGLVTPDV